MNIYILINYGILAVLFTFLLAETVSVLSLIYDRKGLPKIMKYLGPIWGIVGTFAVFFIVNTEVLYPTIMPAIDSLYVFPILLATLLFIGRNVFLVFSEYIWKDSKIDQVSLARVYGIITSIIILILLVVFISIITGIGVNNSLTSFSLYSFLSNYYSIVFIIGVLLIAFGMAFPFYSIQNLKVLSPISTIVGLIIFILSMNNLGILTNYFTYLIAGAITAVSLVYYFTNKSRREIIFFLFFIAVFSINVINYGKVFGTKILSSFLNNSAVSSAGLVVTIVGGVILTAMLAFFLYMYKRPDQKNDYQKDYKDEDNPFSKIGIANLYIIPNNNKENGKEYKKGKNKQH